jgi:tRNA pseudouridine38-40 synthase
MVRIIMGTLIEVGRGKLQPDSITDIIESRNRNNAGKTAPACGLYLMNIKY